MGFADGVTALAFGSLSAWLLGRADIAREREGQMMAAAKCGSPFDVANSEYCAAYLCVDMREYEQAATLAAHALQLAEKHQFPNPAIRSRVALGRARAQLGRAAEGVALIRQGIAGLREIGTRMGLSSTTTWLAEAQERDGAIGDALETVEQALQANPDEVVHRPEAFGLRGELQLKLGHTEMAKADFREAIALAHTMDAKAWELRATMSLARVLTEQGRRDEARAMLAATYAWFTEGFDTADLRNAKALLDELAE